MLLDLIPFFSVIGGKGVFNKSGCQKMVRKLALRVKARKSSANFLKKQIAYKHQWLVDLVNGTSDGSTVTMIGCNGHGDLHGILPLTANEPLI